MRPRRELAQHSWFADYFDDRDDRGCSLSIRKIDAYRGRPQSWPEAYPIYHGHSGEIRRARWRSGLPARDRSLNT